MGTSSSYGGPTGNNPLLPDWAQPDSAGPFPTDDAPTHGDDAGDGSGDDAGDNDSTDEGSQKPPTTDSPPQPQQTPVNFRGAKSSMTRFVSGGGGIGGVGRVARNYVGARGGSRRSAQAATSGRASTGRLGSFLSGVATRGVAAAARDLGLGNLAACPDRRCCAVWMR